MKYINKLFILQFILFFIVLNSYAWSRDDPYSFDGQEYFRTQAECYPAAIAHMESMQQGAYPYTGAGSGGGGWKAEQLNFDTTKWNAGGVTNTSQPPRWKQDEMVRVFLYPKTPQIWAEYLASIDTDEDLIPDIEDNCPNTPNPGQNDFDGDGKGDLCDRDNALLPLKTTIFHGEPITIQTKCCGSTNIWTVTPDDGVIAKFSQSSNSVTVTALSGHGDITATSQSNDNPNCNDTTILNVGCNSCASCSNTKLGP